MIAITSVELSAQQRVDIMDTLFDALKRADQVPTLDRDTLSSWLVRTRAEAEAELNPQPELDDDAMVAELERSL